LNKQSLNELTASEIVSKVTSGETSCEAVIRACIERITAREPEVQAWEAIAYKEAIQTAQEFDRSGQRGPMIGVPFGIKDNIDTEWLTTEWGTHIHRGRRAGRDAACVALSRRAGGIPLGKTVTTKFPDMMPNKTRNPHDLTRTPGGSSSGSAAAVADMMVPVALGTQTTGSTTRPAAFCGVYGFKPSYGHHSRHGVLEVCGSFGTLGILARSIADIALYRDVLLAIPHEPPPSQNIKPPRIGVCRTHVWNQVDAHTQQLLEEAAVRLGKAGAKMTDVNLPGSFDNLIEAHQVISSWEFSRVFTWELDHHREQINSAGLDGRFAEGLSCSHEHYLDMLKYAADCRAAMTDIWDQCDVLLTPGAIGEAPVVRPASPGGGNVFAGADIYKAWTILHVPSMSLPLFEGTNGMPVGLGLVGALHRDKDLFRNSIWIESKLL
jgi:Asp-tRNA(Asn)/Glu-tRNA(Gln) amidotransferase A subunit family amidase